MNLQNIHAGQVVKNYKELCRLLGVEEKTGKAKALQLQDFEHCFKFTRDGHSYVIDEIFSQAIVKEDRRSLGSRSIFVEELSVILLHNLAQVKKNDGHNSVFYGASKLFEELGMVNRDYIPTKKAIKTFLRENPYAMEKFDVDEFYLRTGARLRDIINTALENLSRRYIIRYEIRHQIRRNGEWMTAEKEEETEIMKAKNEAIAQMKVETDKIKGERAVYLARRHFEFYNIVDEILRERFGWEGIYRGYLISFHGSNIESSADMYEREVKEIKKTMLSLNGKIHDAMDRDARSRYKANQKKIDILAEQVWGEISQKQKNKNFMYKPNYIDIQMFLNDKLIRLSK